MLNDHNLTIIIDLGLKKAKIGISIEPEYRKINQLQNYFIKINI